MINRRQLLKILGSFSLFGGFLGTGFIKKGSELVGSASLRRDYFTELGVRKLINGRGTLTTLTGSLMDPAVMEAMDYASRHFVNLNELNARVGERIAEMLNCEDAHVSAGAASAITLATAAAITGKDRELIRSLPNIPGPQREVIMPKTHRVYEQQITLCGAKIVEVEGPNEMRRAINNNTVLAFYFNNAPEKSISREKFVQIGKEYNIPTFNDCASEIPPMENLFKYIEMGFDLVTFSGGKGLQGPQSAGLLYGRKDLIEAARLNHSPNGSIARGNKVNKEEILGMMVALEVYLAKDHAKQREEWDQWVEQIAASARTVPSVETTIGVHAETNQTPTVEISWDQSVIKITPSEVVQKLRHGHPSIEANSGRNSISYRIGRVQKHEVKIVARRTREVLQSAV